MVSNTNTAKAIVSMLTSDHTFLLLLTHLGFLIDELSKLLLVLFSPVFSGDFGLHEKTSHQHLTGSREGEEQDRTKERSRIERRRGAG